MSYSHYRIADVQHRERAPASAILSDGIGMYCDVLDEDVGHRSLFLPHGCLFDNVENIKPVDHLTKQALPSQCSIVVQWRPRRR